MITKGSAVRFANSLKNQGKTKMKLSKKRAREIAEGLLERLQDDIFEILTCEDGLNENEDGEPTDRALKTVELEIIKLLQKNQK